MQSLYGQPGGVAANATLGLPCWERRCKQARRGAARYSPGCPAKQRSTMASRLGFSSAAATRSLSASCLFTAASLAWLPGASRMSACVRGGMHGRHVGLAVAEACARWRQLASRVLEHSSQRVQCVCNA